MKAAFLILALLMAGCTAPVFTKIPPKISFRQAVVVTNETGLATGLVTNKATSASVSMMPAVTLPPPTNHASKAVVTLTWSEAPTNALNVVIGFNVFWGTNSGVYGSNYNIPYFVTNAAMPLVFYIGTNYYFAMTAYNTNGVSWPRYLANRKAYQLGFLSAQIKQQFPGRTLYEFYHTDAELTRLYNTNTTQDNLYWEDVGNQYSWNSDVMNTNTDLPSFQLYWKQNSGGTWTNSADLLTQLLDVVGYDIKLGYKTNYSWVEAGDSVSDPSQISTNTLYTGFLKCCYTAGMNGGIAGYFSFPPGTTNADGSTNWFLGGPGFSTAFPINQPPSWLQQIVALSEIHAQFSQLEPLVDNSDLISGPQVHTWANDQPAYEFTNNQAQPWDRVLARLVRTGNQWIVTAWASDGVNTNVTVTIPTLGTVTVLARDCGSVYTNAPGSSTLILSDPNGLDPTDPFTLPNALSFGGNIISTMGANVLSNP